MSVTLAGYPVGEMKTNHKLIRTGDAIEHVGDNASEIDRIFSELCQHYILLTHAARMGTDMTTIVAKINILQTKLSQL